MEKYNQKLVEEVRQGKAQVQVDQDEKWNDLLNHIFPKRNSSVVIWNFYKFKHNRESYTVCDDPFENLPIIHASKFIEEEVKWVLVSDKGIDWKKRIFITDLGGRFAKPIVTVTDHYTNNYLNGENEIGTTEWKLMREIEEPKEESEINKVLNEILKEYQENESESIVRIIKSKMTK